MKVRSLMACLAILGLALPVQAIDIIDIHANNSVGVPTMLNQTVTISGIVTSPNNVFHTYNLEIYVQDATAGINVWVSGGAASYHAELGDSVTVTAVVRQYNGLVEIGTSIAETTIENHGSGYDVPEAMVITCADLNATFMPDYSEPNEGRLIRINDVSIVSGEWPITEQTGNSFIDINDGTATGLLFIDQDTAVNGSPHPGDTFDVVGILKQFDSTSPYTEGYEIVPRYISDVISDVPGPPIVGIPEVINQTSTSAEIHFETLTPGSSEVEYGTDDSYGITVGDPFAEETVHVVLLDGLASNTIYHFRAKSSDAEGTRYGQDQLLATASDQPGEIHVAMSFTADESYADPPGNEVPESQSLSSILSTMINQATYSVDASLYSFSLSDVRDALVSAHQGGALVRIIIEDDNSHVAADYCASFGIPYITSTFGGNHGAPDYGIMHNKYVVIDGRDADPYNDWVFMGSANMSIAGSNDVNNVVRMKDFGMAQAYTLEFNEMWGSNTQVPNAGTARMGSAKHDDTPHEFLINGLRIEQYMSPSDRTQEKLINAMQTADHSVYFSILAFTNYNFSDAMRDHRYDTPDLELRGVFDEGLGACNNGSVYYEMAGDPCTIYAWDEPADVWVDYPLPNDRLLHHKYMIVDANWTYHDPLVATGSHNWSFSADSRNDENTVIIHDAGVANMFLQEFAQRYHESGGTGPLGEVTAVGDLPEGGEGRLLGAISNFPNPFNPTTNIAFSTRSAAEVSVRIYDANGRLVSILSDGQLMEAGYHILGWNGTDQRGREVASGTYLVKVEAYTPITGHNEKGGRKIIVLD